MRHRLRGHFDGRASELSLDQDTCLIVIMRNVLSLTLTVTNIKKLKRTSNLNEIRFASLHFYAQLIF